MTLFKWSQTAATNDDVDATINWQEGQSPGSVNNSARAMMAAIAKYRDDSHGNLAAGGTATALTLTTNQSFTALTDGIAVTARMTATSGATPTLNVDALGAKSIASVYGTAIPTGALLNGGVYTFVYDSTDDKWIVHGLFGAAAFGLGTGDSPTFTAVTATTGTITTLNIGNADTSLTRTGAGDIAVEGNAVYRAGGTDVPVADGGTGASTAAAARTNLGVPEVFLTSGTATAAATMDIDLTTYTGYRGFRIIISKILPATNATHVWMRFSTDGGSTYDATNYSYAGMRVNTDGTGTGDGSAASNQIVLNLSSALNSGAAYGGSYNIELYDTENTAVHTRCLWRGSQTSQTPQLIQVSGAGKRDATQNTDAVRFLFSSGNIASAAYAVYGML